MSETDSRDAERRDANRAATGERRTSDGTADGADRDRSDSHDHGDRTDGRGDERRDDPGLDGGRVVVAARASDARPDTTEIERLAAAAGHEVVGAHTQRRPEDPGTALGAGKVAELARTVAATDADAVVYDGQLRPGQYAGLVERLPGGTRVIDRYRLVLSIFAAGAGDRAARLQVEAARLRYELPRLRQTSDESLLNRATEKGSPVLDYERRIDRLENRLAELTATAERRRARRREEGFGLVAIAGYTNAGKSTLLRRLADDLAVGDDGTRRSAGGDDGRADGDDTDRAPPDDDGDIVESASVADRLFETLETTTRRGTLDGRPVLVTDTVGLVGGLPHDLVASFSDTLGAVADADVCLLVVDAAAPVGTVRERVRIARETLDEPRGETIAVLNKADRVDDAALAARREAVDGVASTAIAASALTGDGIDRLRERVRAALPAERATVRLPNDGDAQALLSRAYDRGAVETVDYRGDEVVVELAARTPVLERLRADAEALRVE
jgi:GTP-binding protein HflX